MIYRQRFSRLRFFSAIEMTAQYVPAGAALTIMANNLALRFAMSFETVTDEVAESIFNYKTDVPLFESGRDACEHGLKDIDRPSESALKLQQSIIRKRI